MIHFSNESDLADLAIPSITITAPIKVCNLSGITVPITIDGIPAGSLERGCRVFDTAGVLEFLTDDIGQRCCQTNEPIVITQAAILSAAGGGGVPVGDITIAGPLAVTADCGDVSVDLCPATLDQVLASLETINTSINTQTAALQAVLLANQAAIVSELQNVVITIDDGIVVSPSEAANFVVTIDNEPIDVNTENFGDLVAALEAADLTFTIGDQDVTLDVNITNDPLTVEVDQTPVVDAVQAQKTPDYEILDFCALDVNGEKIPRTIVAFERVYNFDGSLDVSRSVILQMAVDGTFTEYALADGETVDDCPVDEIITDNQESFGLTVLPAICASIDGSEGVLVIPAISFNQSQNSFDSTMYFTESGIPVTGSVVQLSDCDCPCEECANACLIVAGFDNDRGATEANGETTTFVVSLDGNIIATRVHDYLSSFDGTNISTYYTPLIADINSANGWNWEVETDVTSPNNGKPTWRVTYSGTTPSELIINKSNGQSVIVLNADGNGNISGGANWPGTQPFLGCDGNAPTEFEVLAF